VSIARAYATSGKTAPFGPLEIPRREPGPTDVEIAIRYCGVCHSDVHTARGEWTRTAYPCVPGHEIVGEVRRVGPAVTGFLPGDRAGVGCMVDSCRHCANCKEGLEQYCTEGGPVWTYNSDDPHGTAPTTYGGYSTSIVVDASYVLRMPTTIDAAASAPLLCAGVTTYSPLRHWGVTDGTRVGVVGLGGLGHMAVKLAAALGGEVIVFTGTPDKADDARRFGASDVVVASSAAEMRRHTGRLQVIIDTVSVSHDLDAYTALLRRDGALVLVGAPQYPHPSPAVSRLINKRRSVAGSLIGGIRETQEMLDFCAAQDITADIELIPMRAIDDAYERMLASNVRYRFVIDAETI
jgi:uncharacterized zinc-type alcohol dehydrogenase-like protein